jgi:hypothetical protein
MMRADDIKHAVLRELAWDTRVEVAEVGIEVDEGICNVALGVVCIGFALYKSGTRQDSDSPAGRRRR